MLATISQHVGVAQVLYALAIVLFVIAFILYLVKPKGPAFAPLAIVLGFIAFALGAILAI
jgi:hypothetical protein